MVQAIGLASELLQNVNIKSCYLPRVTSSPGFKVTVIFQKRISLKQCIRDNVTIVGAWEGYYRTLIGKHRQPIECVDDLNRLLT